MEAEAGGFVLTAGDPPEKETSETTSAQRNEKADESAHASF